MGVHFDLSQGFEITGKIVTTNGTTAVQVVSPAEGERIAVVYMNAANGTGGSRTLRAFFNDGTDSVEVYRSTFTGNTFNFFKNNSTNTCDIPPVFLSDPAHSFDLTLSSTGAIKIAVFYASYYPNRSFGR